MQKINLMSVNDLTGAERKAFAAEVGRILEKLSENGNSDHYGNFPNGKGVLWIDELSKNAGMERRTVQNWWSAFCKSAGLSITPKQATEKAMAYAMMYPETKRGMGALSRNRDNENLSKTEKNNIVYARFILKNDREKAELAAFQRESHGVCDDVSRNKAG